MLYCSDKDAEEEEEDIEDKRNSEKDEHKGVREYMKTAFN